MQNATRMTRLLASVPGGINPAWRVFLESNLNGLEMSTTFPKAGEPLLSSETVPPGDYPKSRTCNEFRKKGKQYKVLTIFAIFVGFSEAALS